MKILSSSAISADEACTQLCATLSTILGERISTPKFSHHQVSVDCDSSHLLEVAQILQAHGELRFEQLIDLSGIDYSAWENWQGKRFAIVCQLLSITHNHRLRIRIFANDDDAPQIPSLTSVWASANWYEREAFDLFGISFDGHPDLRRILTDYGFVGHPFRKDFPVSGHVEMHYDENKRRVTYGPITIEPRELTPRIVRPPNFGNSEPLK